LLPGSRVGLKFPILRSLRSRALGLAFLPFAPAIEIEPDIALALFVAPVLLDAACAT
jgi:monovalent cation/hydrogen antiporter